MLKKFQEFGKKIIPLFYDEENYHSANPLNKEDVFGDSHPFSEIFPYEAYDEENKIFINKNSLGFTIECLPFIGSDQSTQNEITSIVHEMLEEGDSLQCLFWADHRIGTYLQNWEEARHKAKDIYRFLASKRSEHIKNNLEISPRKFRFIFSYSTPLQKGKEETQIADLVAKRSRILKTLSSITYSFEWGVKDFLTTLDGLINYSKDLNVYPKKWNPYQTLSSQFQFGGALKVDEEGLEWKKSDSSIEFKSFRVVDFPEYWSLNSMQNLIGDAFRESYRIKESFYFHYGVHRPNSSKVELEFWKRSQMIEKQGMSSHLRRMIPDLEAELKECNLVRKEQNEGVNFVKTLFSVGIWTDKKGHMPEAEQTLKSIFRINQFNLVENTYLHLPLFISSLPMTWSENILDLERFKLLKTTMATECGNFIPIQGEWMGTHTPGMLMVGKRGELVNFNPFDNRQGNYNIAVAGRSGSGKSVFMQDLLLSGMGIGAKVFIIDVGRSFEKMCQLLGGQYLNFSNKSNLCLNPFSKISEEDEEERLVSFSYIKSIVARMASPVETTSSYENSIIEEAIRATWENKKTKATMTDISLWLKGQEDVRARSLGVMLAPYTNGGIYAKYFEGENNIDFTSQMVLIELEELKEKKDLQAVILQLFMLSITNFAFLGDRKTPFFICFDEGWDLLRGNQTEVFIETLARRLRKYYGSLIVGTQGVEDFFASPGAKAAFENSDWMCLLAQKSGTYSRLESNQRLILTPQTQKLLESVKSVHGEYSEIAISGADGHYSVCRLYLDRFSQLLYSTQAKEFSALSEMREQGIPIQEAIARVVDIQKDIFPIHLRKLGFTEKQLIKANKMGITHQRLIDASQVLEIIHKDEM